MSVDEHGGRLLRLMNIAFVCWGVLFVLGIFQSVFRAVFGAAAGTKILFGLVVILHAGALICLFGVVYHGLAFFVTRLAAHRETKSGGRDDHEGVKL
jgi:hypothetical protein